MNVMLFFEQYKKMLNGEEIEDISLSSKIKKTESYLVKNEDDFSYICVKVNSYDEVHFFEIIEEKKKMKPSVSFNIGKLTKEELLFLKYFLTTSNFSICVLDYVKAVYGEYSRIKSIEIIGKWGKEIEEEIKKYAQ